MSGSEIAASAAPASRIEELEQKLADKKAARSKAKDEQYEKDLEARLELEDEFGELAGVEMARYVSGQPTRAYVRAPDGGEYKRYKANVYQAAQAKSQGKTPRISVQQAQEQLAEACWVYPKTKEERDAMLASYPGLLTPLSTAAAALAEGKAEEEGKD